jgi:uncharacterized glyoxalase superfamily protein PhnB
MDAPEARPAVFPEVHYKDGPKAVQFLLADPDAHDAGAQAGGATIVRAPHDTPWGARGYSSRDLEGFLWGFSTYRPAA